MLYCSSLRTRSFLFLSHAILLTLSSCPCFLNQTVIPEWCILSQITPFHCQSEHTGRSCNTDDVTTVTQHIWHLLIITYMIVTPLMSCYNTNALSESAFLIISCSRYLSAIQRAPCLINTIHFSYLFLMNNIAKQFIQDLSCDTFAIRHTSHCFQLPRPWGKTCDSYITV